jgi:hypothetical protein
MKRRMGEWENGGKGDRSEAKIPRQRKRENVEMHILKEEEEEDLIF